ncbi:hypothetical protein [uncultured Jatrophihabitans sp.]|uniref:hypothetical protein n=1 Tax=uncultured Jatrophihabitans sp. TaxID=1610747 RepID=UPI0035CAD314
MIDDDLLRRARLKAIQQGTSVNAVVREHLRDYVSTEESARAAVEALFALADEAGAGSGTVGRTWTRDDLYER